MALWKPDPTFYPSPKMAMQAPAERLAYVATINPNAMAVPMRWRWWMLIPVPPLWPDRWACGDAVRWR